MVQDVAHEAPRRWLTERQAEAVDQLVDAAEAEVEASGYDGLSVRNVARRAGVAPATAYTYFSSKDHLLAELLWRNARDRAALADRSVRAARRPGRADCRGARGHHRPQSGPRRGLHPGAAQLQSRREGPAGPHRRGDPATARRRGRFRRGPRRGVGAPHHLLRRDVDGGNGPHDLRRGARVRLDRRPADDLPGPVAATANGTGNGKRNGRGNGKGRPR